MSDFLLKLLPLGCSVIHVGDGGPIVSDVCRVLPGPVLSARSGADCCNLCQ